MDLSGLGALSDVDLEALTVLVRPEPLLVRGGADVAVGPLRDVLRRLPTVSILLGTAPPAVAACFDVCVTDAADPPHPWVHGDGSDVGATVAAHPLASLALVALLRSTGHGDVWTGLAAESATYAALLGGDDFRSWLATQDHHVSEGPAVRTDRTGDCLVITLDRPEVHNAFNRAMRDQLVEALQLAASDRTIAEVVLEGAGPSFSSGGDLAEFGTVPDPPTAHAVRLTRHPGWWMEQCRDRVVAHLHGACIGAGIELPAFAARVEAAPDSSFALPEVGMGLIPGAGGTVSVTRRIGRQRCAWLALSGARLDATTALRWGLVDRVSPG